MHRLLIQLVVMVEIVATEIANRKLPLARTLTAMNLMMISRMETISPHLAINLEIVRLRRSMAQRCFRRYQDKASKACTSIHRRLTPGSTLLSLGVLT